MTKLRRNKTMIESFDPFNDPEFKKQILKSEGKTYISEVEETEELLGEDLESPNAMLNSIISNAPTIPGAAKNLILDASAVAKNQKEAKAQEINLALNNVITNYNREYGTNLHIDFENISKTLVNISNPETRKTLELVVSEIFKSVRPIILLQIISKLQLAIDYVLTPERMFSQDFSSADLFLVIEKLMQYIEQLNSLMETTTVKDSDQILKKLAEQKKNNAIDSEESKQVIEDFMAIFRKDSGIG